MSVVVVDVAGFCDESFAILSEFHEGCVVVAVVDTDDDDESADDAVAYPDGDTLLLLHNPPLLPLPLSSL
jgi:hypothetical protein